MAPIVQRSEPLHHLRFDDAMLTHSTLTHIARWLPRLFSGRQLHRMALAAAHAGDQPRAERLFKAAVTRYRSELRVDALARLRVHQQMTRIRAGRDPEQHDALMLDVERRLSNLEAIETLEPPFEVIEARTMLASWQGHEAAPAEPERRAA